MVLSVLHPAGAAGKHVLVFGLVRTEKNFRKFPDTTYIS